MKSCRKQENEDIKKLHEEWAQKNGYRDNELLHAKNTQRFVNEKGGDSAQRPRQHLDRGSGV